MNKLDFFLENAPRDVLFLIKKKLLEKKKFEKIIIDYIVKRNTIQIHMSHIYPKLSLMTQVFCSEFFIDSSFNFDNEKNRIVGINKLYISYKDSCNNVKQLYVNDFVNYYYNDILKLDITKYLFDLM